MIFLLFEIIIAILLIGAIVLQMQGSGLSTAFGGAGEFYRSKRSIERILFVVTIILAALFALNSIVLLLHR